MMLDTATPVLLLGGKENSLSVARNLGRHGITVRISGPRNCWGLYSRHCAEALPVPRGQKQVDYWRELLLGHDERLNGHIVLALSDVAIEFMLANRDLLAQRYRLDEIDPALQTALLDKQRTLELAAGAGVDAPQFWAVGNVEELEALRPLIRFPAIVKPKQSHRFQAIFKAKLFHVQSDFEELKAKAAQCWQHGIDVVICEEIPGPDSRLASYYTYIDRSGRRLFRYTKRIIRRWPINQGNACYHANEWNPEVAEAAEKLLSAIGWRGLANVEFKRDIRDGKLKLIEVNTRITAAQELPVQAGIPIDLIIYRHLTGQPVPAYDSYREDVRLWHPLRDFLAFLQERKKFGTTFRQWLTSLRGAHNARPLYSLSDPWPMAGAAFALLAKFFEV